MKTKQINEKTSTGKAGLLKVNAFLIGMISMFFLSTLNVSAHCDTMDGPLISDARKAIDQNNVNYVLKWVQPEHEKEIRDIFALSMKVRSLSAEARELADRYFFETVVRIHRSGEGVPFTGIKPSGTPIDEKIKAADKSLETGNLKPLAAMVPKEMLPELTERFKKALSLRNFDVNNVKAGREYIEAYVQFFKYAEGEEEAHEPAHHNHS